jgi:hypothetical protein
LHSVKLALLLISKGDAMALPEIVPTNDKQEISSRFDGDKLTPLQKQGLELAYRPAKDEDSQTNKSDSQAKDDQSSNGKNNAFDDDDSSATSSKDSGKKGKAEGKNGLGDQEERQGKREYFLAIEDWRVGVLANAPASAAGLAQINADIARFTQYLGQPGVAEEVAKLQRLRSMYGGQLSDKKSELT